MSGDRNEKAREELKQSATIAQQNKVEGAVKKLSAYQERVKANNLSNFVFNKLWGNRYATLAIAVRDQVTAKRFEMSNGILYTKEVLEAEYHIQKHQAIKAFAKAQINVKELEDLGISKAEIDKYLQDTIDSPIFRENNDYLQFDDGEGNMSGGFVNDSESGPTNSSESVPYIVDKTTGGFS